MFSEKRPGTFTPNQTPAERLNTTLTLFWVGLEREVSLCTLYKLGNGNEWELHRVKLEGARSMVAR
jgi:hypothetical protein